jgi:predicted metallopeptidase
MDKLHSQPVGATADARRRGLDFTGAMQRLCVDMAVRLPELAHVDMARVAVSFCQTRSSTRQGVFASLTPLRFPGGHSQTVRRGRRLTIQRVVDAAGREMLYLLSFYLPRFLDLPYREKLSTVLHELWHIGPSFDGDLRRFSGRCYAHGGSRKRYDADVESLTQRWLDAEPPNALHALLRHDFRQILADHGGIHGRRYARPRLVPVPDGSSTPPPTAGRRTP